MIKGAGGMPFDRLLLKSRALYVSKRIIAYSVLIFSVLLIFGPLYVVLITSLKTRIEAMSADFTFWPSSGLDFHGYKDVFTYKSGLDAIPTIFRGFINTLVIVVPTAFIGTLVSSVSAYSFSKLRFAGKRILFGILLATMMIPGTITLVPSYILFDTIGWVDTPLPLMVPGMLGGATCVFFMRQFYSGIPDDLVESAQIDGMSYIGIFFKIMMPLSLPAFFAQLVLAFVGGYNDYLGPLLYLQSPSQYTLQIALNFFQGTYSTDWAVVMAGAVVSLVPTVLIYILAQKYFIAGIATAGLKI
jgi:multiple sugar transport system permease protein